MKKTVFPIDWDERRVRRVIEHYEGQSDDEAVAEDETVSEDHTAMEVPTALVPAIRALIAKHHNEHGPDET